MKPQLLLIGGGGHCRSCIDVIERNGCYRIAGIIDVPGRLGETVLGHRIIGEDSNLPSLVGDYEFFLITLGQIKTPEPRMALFELVKTHDGKLPAIVSPLAYVSEHARLGEGTIVMHHAVLNAGSVIGRNCIINSKALVEHDADIGDNCHISTGALVNGGVAIGPGTFIGSGTITAHQVQIGSRCVVGAGSVLLKDLPSGSFYKAGILIS